MEGIIFLIVLYAFLFYTVSSRPGGAPLGTCVSMAPNPTSHRSNGSQAGESPFQVIADKSNYMAGEEVMVTIRGSSTARFVGLLVQAREVGKDDAIGTFPDPLPSGIKNLNCNNPQGAITQSGRGNWETLTLKWKAPSDVSGIRNISFLATVVQDVPIYWVKLESPQLLNRLEDNSACAFSLNIGLFSSAFLMLTAYTMF